MYVLILLVCMLVQYTGPEAADGRPSPELRDSVHTMVSETNILRVHTDSHNSHSSVVDSQGREGPLPVSGVCTCVDRERGCVWGVGVCWWCSCVCVC